MQDEQHGIAAILAADRDPLRDAADGDEARFVDAVRRRDRRAPRMAMLKQRAPREQHGCERRKARDPIRHHGQTHPARRMFSFCS